MLQIYDFSKKEKLVYRFLYLQTIVFHLAAEAPQNTTYSISSHG